MVARLEDIVGAALERSPEERAAYLDRACGDQAVLRREAESLILAHDQAGPFLTSPTVDPEGWHGQAERNGPKFDCRVDIFSVFVVAGRV